MNFLISQTDSVSLNNPIKLCVQTTCRTRGLSLPGSLLLHIRQGGSWSSLLISKELPRLLSGSNQAPAQLPGNEQSSGWGDGTSRNCLSLYECSGNHGPLHKASQKHNVPGLIAPYHYMHDTIQMCDQNDRDVSIQVCCVTRDD